MAFADLLAQDAPGVVWMLDVSTDDFATVSYRYSTASMVDGSANQYDGRIHKMGRYNRGFGQDGFPAAGTLEVSLDNTDFAADWLVDRSTFATSVLKARFRLRLGLYDAPNAGNGQQASVTTQVMGELVLLDFPSRDNTLVRLSLADDSLGRSADLAISPSLNDWVADGDTTTTNCPISDTLIDKLGNWSQPMQLVFGRQMLRVEPVHVGLSQAGGSSDWYGVIPLSATTATSSTPGTALEFYVEYGEEIDDHDKKYKGTAVRVPATFINSSGTSVTVWEVKRSESISSDSKTWRINWVQFNVTKYLAWLDLSGHNLVGGGPTPTGGVSPQARLYPEAPHPKGRSPNAKFWEAFVAFHVNISTNCDSQRTGSDFNGVDFITDLLSYYAKTSSTDIDATSFASVKAATAAAMVRGVIQPAQSARSAGRSGIPHERAGFGVNKLREAIGEILASIDCEMFISWTGLYKLQTLGVTFAGFTTTPTAIDETRLVNVEERTPSIGERWSPYNRLFVLQNDGSTTGPYDHPTTVASWGKVFPRTINAKWFYDPYQTQTPQIQATPWQSRLVESVHRPVLRFDTDMSVLTFELGDFALISWTRLQGGSTPHSSAIFRLESFSIDPETMAVTVEAVWMADLQSEKPYLLDNEVLIQLNSTAVSVGVVNGDNTVTANSGDWAGDGAEVGDLILIKDTSISGDADFTNQIATRITAISGDEAEVVYSGWTTNAAIATADVTILKGATTYPTSGDDPTNYPSGGTMYGKASGATDLFSDSSAANLLKDG